MEDSGNRGKEMEMRNIPKEKMTRLNVQMNNIKKRIRWLKRCEDVALEINTGVKKQVYVTEKLL